MMVSDNGAMPVSVSSATQSTATRRPPGPDRYLYGKTIEGMRDALNFNMINWKNYGDSIYFPAFPGFGWYLFVHPSAVEQILQTNQSNYQKPMRFLQPFGYLGGRGLLTNEGEHWRKQRRLIQPSFHRERLAALGDAMSQAVCQHVQEWEKLPEGQIIDLFSEMSKLTFRVIGRTLFGDDLSDKAPAFFTSLEHSIEHISNRMNSPVLIPDWLPTPANQRFHQHRNVLDDVVYGIIERRQSLKEPPQDLLDMLMKSTFEGTDEGMNIRQLRDEIMTLLISGHETVALSLTWALFLLGENRHVEAVLLDELKSVLDGNPAKMENLPKLPYNKMVYNEALRLYPPIWGQPREAIAEDEIQGFRVEKGLPVTVCQYFTHRHPEFFPEPERFNPERFLPENEAQLPKFAFFPFGGGSRSCIGNHFAMAEGQMALATILQRFKFELLAGQNVEPKAGCTLRPAKPIKVRLLKRTAPL
jgi:cytochrome P450